MKGKTSGEGGVRSDTKHFAPCGKTRYYCRIYCRKFEEKNCDFLKGMSEMKERDEKYYDAVKAVLTKERAGVSFLQRELGLGYAHAARYIDLMIEDGILKREDSKPWLLQILVSLEEWLRKNPRQNK